MIKAKEGYEPNHHMYNKTIEVCKASGMELVSIKDEETHNHISKLITEMNNQKGHLFPV